MATYGDNPREYPHLSQRYRKQKYSLIQRVVDFANLPITGGNKDHKAGGASGRATTAWAAGDVLEFIGVRAGQTVLGITVDVIEPSGDSGDWVEIGFEATGQAARWGRVSLYQEVRADDQMLPFADHLVQAKATAVLNKSAGMFGAPYYFTSKDTIDLTIGKAALVGKIRVVVHILEDDR